MPFKRKITYYEISSSGKSNCIDLLKSCTDRIRHANRYTMNSRYKPLSGGGDMHVSRMEKVGPFYYGFSKAILNEFPEITNKKDNLVERIEGEDDLDKGINKETHFVVAINPNYVKPIIAVESSAQGPKFGDLERYLNITLMDIGEKHIFQFEPVFAFNYDEFIDRIDDVAKIRMVFNRSDLDEYNQYDPQTGKLLYNAFNYGESEYIALEFGINFQKTHTRYETAGLLNRVKHFVNIFKKKPASKDLIRKLDVKAQDKNFDGRLRLFDLIESKVASEVKAEKRRPRSQYYDSPSLYEAIRTQIENDFGT